jgi:hypothetical protein
MGKEAQEFVASDKELMAKVLNGIEQARESGHLQLESCEMEKLPPQKQWIARIGELRDVLSVCPTDILAERELATLLEQLGQLEEALCHWNAVLACDPNSLNDRDGVAQCRGQPLQPGL